MDNKNYYELLEVDRNASIEIINRAYKLLVKKYHPDLQENSEKEKYEEIIKKINEAYEVLSDEKKRKEYDILLEKNYISKEEYNKLNNENEHLKQELNNMYKNENINNSSNSNIQENIHNEYEKKLNDAINKAYYDAYIQDLKNRGYKIKYKKTIKNYLTSLITIFITIIIIFAICKIPLVNNYLLSIYNDNQILKTVVDTFKNTFNL